MITKEKPVTTATGSSYFQLNNSLIRFPRELMATGKS